MPKLDERGFAVILIVGGVVAAIAGLVAAVYVAQHRTNIAPKAEEFPAPSITSMGTKNTTGAPAPIQFPKIQLPNLSFLTAPKSEPAPVSSGTGSTDESIPTSTPGPTAQSTYIPQASPDTTETPTPTSTPTPSLTPTPTPSPISSPIASSLYRVSFDPNFSTLIDTGDGGIFGVGSEKVIPVSLIGNPGQKYVYIQFFEENTWKPEIPIVASIQLLGELSSPDQKPQPTISPIPTSVPDPTPTSQQVADSDGDGDPDSTDCGRTDSRAHHGQTQYFMTPYTNNSGQNSFDYNCSGAVEGQTVKDGDIVSTLPGDKIWGCYTERPSGVRGWANSIPQCGTQGAFRSCGGSSALNCAVQIGAANQSECPAQSASIKSWVVYEYNNPNPCR